MRPTVFPPYFLFLVFFPHISTRFKQIEKLNNNLFSKIDVSGASASAPFRYQDGYTAAYEDINIIFHVLKVALLRIYPMVIEVYLNN